MTGLRGDRGRFRVRAAGIAIRDGRVLVSRALQPSSWKNSALVGGGVEPGESSADAVVREFREELGVAVAIGRLFYCVENFFRHEGDDWHEVGFYWEVRLPPDAVRAGRGAFRDFDALAGRVAENEWEWCPLDRLGEIDLLPSFLVEGLRDLPRTPRFLVHRDADSSGGA